MLICTAAIPSRIKKKKTINIYQEKKNVYIINIVLQSIQKIQKYSNA